MKRYSIFFSGLLLILLLNQIVSAQTKKSAESLSARAQIKPEFSKMVDYGFPTGTGVHEFPGGKAPVSKQINPDGSVKVSRTGEITVPSDNPVQTQKKKSDEKSAPKKSKTKIH